MKAGIPLSEYLNTTQNSHSDEQREQELFQPGPPDTQAALAEALNKNIKKNAYEDSVDSAVKSASNSVKVLGPLLAAATRWSDPAKDSENIESIMGKVLSRLRDDALHVIAAYNIETDEAPAWLISQISGQLMELLVAAIDRNNGAVLNPNDRSYLDPLISMAKQAGGLSGSIYNNPSNPQLQIMNSLMMATADVMTEYHSFNYFHTDSEQVSQQVSDVLNERIIEGTLATLTERFNLTADEQAYFGASILKQAGNALADAWSRNIPNTLANVKHLATDQRHQVLLTGCPLDEVFDDFENVIQGLEIAAQSALRTLAPHREATRKPSHGQSL